MAHWIISLKDDTHEGKREKAFVTTFKKCRNCAPEDAPPIRWTILLDSGEVKLTSDVHRGPEALLELIRQGVDTAKELAEELNVTVGCISKWAKKLKDSGAINIQARKYYPTAV